MNTAYFVQDIEVVDVDNAIEKITFEEEISYQD